MTNNSKSQLGYFLQFSFWQDALNLLDFQIEQKQNNRHYNTLSMFYYEKLNTECLKLSAENYFKTKIATSLFYGLKEEFAVFYYVIPKAGLGLRDYKFFTYPMQALYYAIGLYLLKLSQDFLQESYGKTANIKSFYGGNLSYKKDELQINKSNTYYRSFHKEFKKEIKNEAVYEVKDKVMIKLDIENYFKEISIPNLLHLIHNFIKPSIQVSMSFDTFTREQISCLFQFIANGASGIPQGDNNIISSFLGHLYLVFGDLFIDDILNKNLHIIDSHKIIRYTDDIYISIIFKQEIGSKEQGAFIHSIASQIAEVMYSKLNLKLNLKTRLFCLRKEKDQKELLKKVRKWSPDSEYEDYEENPEDTEQNDSNPEEKIKKIFKELGKLKKSEVDDFFVQDRKIQEEILQEIFDKRVEQIIDKPANKLSINKIFNNFNFDLIKVQPLEILILILKDEDATQKLRKFLLQKTIITTSDADLIIRFLCQTNFSDSELLLKLKQNSHLKNIVDVFLDAQLKCNEPGYYSLSCMQMKKLSVMPDVIEQMRLRVLSERGSSYSVALNHLLNEIHAVCIKQEQADKKTYDANDVVRFLRTKNISHETCIKIRNLFDRRNSNQVSHPGSDNSIAWEVTQEDYLDYYRHVGECLDYLL